MWQIGKVVDRGADCGEDRLSLSAQLQGTHSVLGEMRKEQQVRKIGLRLGFPWAVN